jgi:hypothetical protein
MTLLAAAARIAWQARAYQYSRLERAIDQWDNGSGKETRADSCRLPFAVRTTSAE